jgi:hypothetical protein
MNCPLYLSACNGRPNTTALVTKWMNRLTWWSLRPNEEIRYDACPCWSVLVSCDETADVQKVSWDYCCPHQVCCCQTGPQHLLLHFHILHGPSNGPPGSDAAIPPPFGPVPLHWAEKISKICAAAHTSLSGMAGEVIVSCHASFCVCGMFKQVQ